jgi:hypothetical protein
MLMPQAAEFINKMMHIQQFRAVAVGQRGGTACIMDVRACPHAPVSGTSTTRPGVPPFSAGLYWASVI